MAKLFASKKYIISIEEFMDNYVGKHYDGKEKLTHRVMSMYLHEKCLPRLLQMRISSVTTSDILTGRYLLVRDKNNQVLVYRNPAQHNLNCLLDEINASHNPEKLETIRDSILSSLGYTYNQDGEVVTKQECEEQQQKAKLTIEDQINCQKYKRQSY